MRCDLIDDEGCLVDSQLDQDVEFHFNLMLDSLEDWKITTETTVEHKRFSLSGKKISKAEHDCCLSMWRRVFSE